MNLALRVAGIAMVAASLAAGPLGAQTMPQQEPSQPPPPAASPGPPPPPHDSNRFSPTVAQSQLTVVSVPAALVTQHV